jgi:hypothetical protein
MGLGEFICAVITIYCVLLLFAILSFNSPPGLNQVNALEKKLTMDQNLADAWSGVKNQCETLFPCLQTIPAMMLLIVVSFLNITVFHPAVFVVATIQLLSH